MSMCLSQGPVLDAQRSFVTSALPDAPVIPHVEPRVRTAATRRTVALALHRLADRIAPTPNELAC
jgi:hypothetical protein